MSLTGPDLWIGIILAVLKELGNIPLDIELLNKELSMVEMG